jgi:NitT/TauT family transport system substrate-binding protein
MQMIQNRRDFLTSLSAAGAAGMLSTRGALADEGPPEVTTVRIRVEDAPPLVVSGVAENAVCNAPLYITDDLLRAEGFTDVRYVLVKNGPPYAQAFERREIDFGLRFAPGAVRSLDAGVPITVLAGVHPGCFNLFVQEPIQTFTDLKGRQVGITDSLGSAPHLYVSIMAAHVGLDPENDINWVTTTSPARWSCSSRAGSMRTWLSCRNFPSCAPARSATCSSTWRWTGHGRSTSAACWSDTRTSSGNIRLRPNARCAPS